MKKVLLVVGLLAALATGGWTLAAQAGQSGEAPPPCAPDGPLCRPCCK